MRLTTPLHFDKPQRVREVKQRGRKEDVENIVEKRHPPKESEAIVRGTIPTIDLEAAYIHARDGPGGILSGNAGHHQVM